MGINPLPKSEAGLSDRNIARIAPLQDCVGPSYGSLTPSYPVGLSTPAVSSLTAEAGVSLLIGEDSVVFDCRRAEA